MTRTKRIRSVIALAILASISFPPGAAATDFAKAKFYPVGTNPFVIVTGDFNGDGKLDMAVANVDSSDVSILLGNGDGTFQPAKNIAIAGGFGPIVTGDFNGDRKLDLAVGSETNATLLLGNGDGTFQSPHGQGIDYAFEIADFNGDSKPDVLSPAGILLAMVTAPSSPLARSPRSATPQIPVAFLISLPQPISTETGNSISLSPLPRNVSFAISQPFLSKSSLARATALSNRPSTWASAINTSPLGISMAMERWIWRPRQASTREVAWFTSCLARATARFLLNLPSTPKPAPISFSLRT
jgi:hypothetical protein